MAARITFIMPTFNRAALIAESIQPVLDQMSADDRLIVVDDGSTDTTPEVLAGFGDRITVERIENRGKSGALNHALRLVTSEWVWICDDDDLLADGAVDALVGAAEASGADFVFGRYMRFEGAPDSPIEPGYWPDLSRGSVERHLLEDFFIFQHASLVRTDLYRKAGPFNEALPRSIDYDMILRLIRHAHPRFVDRVIFAQRIHSGARGPAAARHSADQMESVWIETDRRLFAPIARADQFTRFEAMFSGGAEWERQRIARLQRATILLRHELIDEGFRDLEEAAKLQPAQPLSALERATVQRALGGKLSSCRPPSPALIAGLRTLGSGDRFRREVQREMIAGVAWRLRGGSPGHRTAHIALVRGVLSPRGIVSAAFMHLLRKAGLAGRGRSSAVVEIDPPLSA
jgi:glycosyltransferase involved in cell wall biosynthesis